MHHRMPPSKTGWPNLNMVIFPPLMRLVLVDPKPLNADQKLQQRQPSEQHLEFLRRDPNDFLSRLVSMDETRLYHYDPETKQQSVEWRHSGSPCPKKFRVQKSAGKVLALILGGSRRHRSHWLSSKGPNYQRGVLLISSGAIEGQFEGKTSQEVHQGGLVLAQQCPGSPGTWSPEQTGLLGLPVSWSPTLFSASGPSDYHLFPELKKIESSPFFVDVEVIAAAKVWLDAQPSEFFLSDFQKLEQRVKKCTELRGEYVE